MSSTSFSRIAIVGMGGLFPDAENINQYWDNILSKKVSIDIAPESYLNRDVFYDKSVQNNVDKDDKSYTEICGFINNFELDIKSFRIPPMVLEQMDDNQKAALYTAAQAISEVSFDRIKKDKVAVIMGDGSYDTLHSSFEKRLIVKEITDSLKRSGADSKSVDIIEKEFLSKIKPITEDSAPGTLRNITAGRIANIFDFHGPSYTVNSACASGLTAIIKGAEGLLSGAHDAVVCGATDMSLQDIGFSYFSAMNALSADGAFPFDERANGFVIGQGAGVVVLKRVDDAIRDGDKIYALISGFGQASDGKGKAIAAPEKKWQSRTIEQACKMADYSPETIEYIEAHGTATKVGDYVETQALKDAFKKLGAKKRNYCGLSSVKSNIGHLKSAAGVAGFIKAALSIHNKVLPPTAGFKKLNPKLELEESPFYVIDKPIDWEEKDHPRRAGVSAFGFGGADYHIALEEFREIDFKNDIVIDNSHNIQFSADSTQDLENSLKNFKNGIEFSNNITDEVFRNNCISDVRSKYKLAFQITSKADYADKMKFFIDNYKNKPESLKLKQIYYTKDKIVEADKIAVMFPGQGAQYSGMMKELNEYPQFNQTMNTIDVLWQSENGEKVSDILNSSDEFLRETENTHPAVFSTSISLYNQLKSIGLKSDYLIGHSLGEITALSAGGALSLKDSVKLINSRGNSFKSILDCDGLMAAVKLTDDDTNKHINIFGKDIYISNINSPEQTIVSGQRRDVEEFCNYLKKAGERCSIINVSYPFHSPLVKDAENRFIKDIENIDFKDINRKVMCNHLNSYYSADGDKVKKVLGEQITSSVKFTDSIKKLYNDGVRLFIEVGPSSILSGLVNKILDGKDADILTSNYNNRSDKHSFNNLICSLFTNGVELNQLTENRFVEEAADHKAIKQTGKIVFSGASVGLPGSYKDSFRDDNFEQLFKGNNLIEKLSDEEKNSIVDLQVSKLIKSEKGASFKILSNINDVIQLAGKAGKLDLNKYKIPEKEILNMSSTIAMAVAAGYEALRDAQIPLVREYNKTASGKSLPGRWMLPEEMQDDTGIIFPNGFPMVDPIINEVSRYISYIYGSKIRKDLIEFYETIISKISDYQTKKVLTDWFAVHFLEISDNPGEEDIYRFNHHFMNQIASQANNRLASYIGAKGPNFLINAACSSTSTAISLAEDLIKSGRVKRMIIIGGDDPTSKGNMPLIGSGFLCTGAASTNGNIYEAAVPFDKRRNGMIMGSGAIGLVVESEAESVKRGVAPVCQLMGSHLFNTAGHASRIEYPHYEKELNKFITNIEDEYKLDRKKMADQMIYMSHETYTPAKGGCSQTEAKALQAAFGKHYSNIIVTNTKGMTGHTMGASIEDAVAAKSLQYGKCPPVVNYSVPDPELKGLKLSDGGDHSCSYALKMAAGFGAQGNYVLLKKMAKDNERIIDQKRYNKWLESISNDGNTELVFEGRLLVLKDNNTFKSATVEKIASEPDSTDDILEVVSKVTGYPVEMLEPGMEMEADLGIDTVKQATVLGMLGDRYGFEESEDFKLSDYPTIGHIIGLFSGKSSNASQPIAVTTTTATAVKDIKTEISKDVIKVISEVSGYPTEMLEPEMEMEADLGIDTVKQATILGMLGDSFGFEESEDFKLSDYPTIGHIIGLFGSYKTKSIKTTKAEEVVSNTSEVVIKIISEVSGYPIEMLEPEMEMEADLGIDTVKQATILAMLGDRYGFEESEDFKLSDYPTIGHIVKLFEIESISHAEKPDIDVKGDVLKVISEVTGYPVEMLEPEMEMEADLGIDTVKQATVLAMLGENYGFDESEDFKLSDYPSIGHIITLFSNNTVITDSVETKVEEVIENSVPNDLSRDIVVLSEEKLTDTDFVIEGANVLLIGKTINKKLTDSFTEKGARIINCDIAEVPSCKEVDLIVDTTIINEKIKYTEHDRETMEVLLNRAGQDLFNFYKKLDEKLDVKPKKIICITNIDGSLGFGGDVDSSINPLYGSYAGFYKSLRKEWNTKVKILDLKPGQVSLLIKEIEKNGTGFEVCYQNKKRMVLKIDEKEIISNNKVSFSKSDLLLVTGGATGITAEIIKEMAGRYNCRFAITGRTVIPENIDELCSLSKDELNDLKISIHEDLKKSHDRVTPIMVTREYNKIEKAIKVQSFINYFKERDIELSYYSADVTDFRSMENAVIDIKKKYGEINGIVHAAGVEKSNYITKKTTKEFNLVYKTKVMGAYNLSELCKNEPLKLAVAFSSISGRFGNAAQLDYSAANNFLSYWIKWMKGINRDINAISIIWSGWKDVGMAWRNDFVRLHSEEQGLNLIHKEAGIDAFIKEIENNTGDLEVIISRGLGNLLEAGLSVTNIDRMPLIDRIEKNKGNIVRAYKNLSVKRDEFMNQHRLGETPLMPAVSYMELCSEYYSLVKGVKDQYVIRDLDILGPMKLYKEQSREIMVDGKLDADSDKCEMTLSYKFSPGNSKEVKEVPFSKLVLTDDSPSITEFDSEKWTPKNIKKRGIMAFFDLDISSSQKIIFGPLYQDLMRTEENSKNSEVSIGDEGIIYPISFPLDQIHNDKYPLDELLINPCIIDSIFQGAAFGCIALTNRVYLPCGAEEFGIVKVAREVDDYRVYVKLIKEVGDEIYFDAVMVNSANEVNYYAKTIKFRRVSL